MRSQWFIRTILGLAVVLLGLVIVFAVVVGLSSWIQRDYRTGTIYTAVLVAHSLAIVALFKTKPTLAVLSAALVGIVVGGAALEISQNDPYYLVSRGPGYFAPYLLEFIAFVFFMTALLCRIGDSQSRTHRCEMRTVEPTSAGDAATRAAPEK